MGDLYADRIRTSSICQYMYRAEWYNNQSYNVDFLCGQHSGKAIPIFCSVGYSHYNTAYQACNISWNYVYGGVYNNQNTILNSTTGAAGAISYSCPSSGWFRVSKSSGSYGGLGFVNMLIWSVE